MALKVVGLGGSLAAHSTSLAALRVALEGAAEARAEVELLDLKVLDLPLYSPDLTVTPSVARFCNTVYGAQGLLWSSPLYNGTISGSFKNALDWLHLLGDRKPPYLTDKIVGLISTAGGTQGLQAVNTMEFVVRALRAWAVPLVIPIPQAWRAIKNDRVLDEGVAAQLRALGGEVARVAGQFADRALTSPDAAKAERTALPASEEEGRGEPS